MRTKRPTSGRELSDYERYWEAELPSDPSKVFVGLGVAFAIAVCIITLPWVVSFLQDEGLIKPQLHLQLIPTSSRIDSQTESRQIEAQPGQPQQAPAPANRFGAPRNY